MSKDETADQRLPKLLGFNGLSDADRAYVRAMLCSDCGKFPADLPSKLCPGCEAYREHQR